MDKVAQVDSVDKGEVVPESANKTIKVTATNKKRLTALAGELAKDGDFHSHNDAINYLFNNQKEKTK